jgi:hypothetical protein
VYNKKGFFMEQTLIFMEIEEQIQNLRKIILQHAREQDLTDEEFLVDLHQLTYRILTLKRMLGNGTDSDNGIYKNYLEHASTAH